MVASFVILRITTRTRAPLAAPSPSTVLVRLGPTMHASMTARTTRTGAAGCTRSRPMLLTTVMAAHTPRRSSSARPMAVLSLWTAWVPSELTQRANTTRKRTRTRSAAPTVSLCPLLTTGIPVRLLTTMSSARRQHAPSLLTVLANGTRSTHSRTKSMHPASMTLLTTRTGGAGSTRSQPQWPTMATDAPMSTTRSFARLVDARSPSIVRVRGMSTAHARIAPTVTRTRGTVTTR